MRTNPSIAQLYRDAADFAVAASPLDDRNHPNIERVRRYLSLAVAHGWKRKLLQGDQRYLRLLGMREPEFAAWLKELPGEEKELPKLPLSVSLCDPANAWLE